MTIIAIDPGYDRCGVAFVKEEHGKMIVVESLCIETNKKDSHEKRIAYIFETLQMLIKKHSPIALALETLFFSVNKKTALKVAEARGALVLLAGLAHIPLVEIAPQTVKISLTGTGNASKEQVEKMVRLTISLPKKKILDDEIDAIALGVASLQSLHLEKLKKGIAK